jgi:hypothetical protein
VIPALHIHYEQIVITIPIEIGHSHGHRGKAEMAERQGRRSPKMAVAIVKPETIGRAKIIADI